MADARAFSIPLSTLRAYGGDIDALIFDLSHRYGVTPAEVETWTLDLRETPSDERRQAETTDRDP